MDIYKAKSFLEEGFLKPLIEDKNITDISFNGREIYYLHNERGRCKSSIIISQNEAKDFLRHLANISEQQFSFSSPILDISFDKYRLTGLFSSIGRVNNDKGVTFSLRIASEELKIRDDNNSLPTQLIHFLKTSINRGQSIVIGGITGSGKTELQKYLISSLPNMSRVIVIDNVLELNMNKYFSHLDLNIWQSDERNKTTSIQSLVRTALRSNPDWLIVSESRGEEMIDVLNSVMTGHPIITTIHAYDIKTMPFRMASMVLMNDKKMEYKEVLNDIYQHFPIYIYMKRKTIDGKVIRFISSVMLMDRNGKGDVIYKIDDGVTVKPLSFTNLDKEDKNE